MWNYDLSVLSFDILIYRVEEFLRSFPENEIVLQKIDETMEQFNNTYVIVKNFEAHVVRKVHDLFTYSLEVTTLLICYAMNILDYLHLFS